MSLEIKIAPPTQPIHSTQNISLVIKYLVLIISQPLATSAVGYLHYKAGCHNHNTKRRD
jgi:hypothetical protein